MGSTRIKTIVKIDEYDELIKRYEEQIKVSPHAYFRLADTQRKVYKDDYLKNVLKDERPKLVGIQQNGRYTAFFKRKEGYLRVIFSVNHEEHIEIITFYITNNMPRIK